MPAPDLQEAVSAIADELAEKARVEREEPRVARELARDSAPAETASDLAGDTNDTEVVNTRWAQVMSLANEEAGTVAAHLTMASVSVTPDAVILRFPHDAAINARMVEKEKSRNQITPIVARVFGHELQLIIEVEDAPQPVHDEVEQVRKPKKPRLDQAPSEAKANDPTDVPASAATRTIDPRPYENDPLVQAFLKAFDGRVVKAEKEN